jgi:hypothetical protein
MRKTCVSVADPVRAPGTEGTCYPTSASATLNPHARYCGAGRLGSIRIREVVGLRLLNRSVSLDLAVPSKCAFVADMKIYRAVQVDDAGDSWSVLVSEDGGPYEWLPVTYYTFAAAEAAIVRFKQAEAGATFSRDRAATPAWIRQKRFCF